MIQCPPQPRFVSIVWCMVVPIMTFGCSDSIEPRSIAKQNSPGNVGIETTKDQAEQALAQLPSELSVSAMMKLGDTQLRAGDCQGAVDRFEQVIDLRPNLRPDLWQYGIALFFVGRFDDARQLFEEHRVVNPNDVENAAWHYLCVAKAAGVETAREIVLPAPSDRRVPMKQILDRLSGGELQSIHDAVNAHESSAEFESASFYSALYIGLIADAEGDSITAAIWMKKAAATNLKHYMADVARVYSKRLQ